jgi:hypothetical protein
MERLAKEAKRLTVRHWSKLPSALTTSASIAGTRPQSVGETLDLTGDRGVLKELLYAPRSHYVAPHQHAAQCPKMYQVARVRFVARLLDGTIIDDTNQTADESSDKTIEFRIGLKQPAGFFEGLDLAVLSMCVGERAKVTIRSEYAYGSREISAMLGEIPPHSTLIYEVELCGVSDQLYIVGGTRLAGDTPSMDVPTAGLKRVVALGLNSEGRESQVAPSQTRLSHVSFSTKVAVIPDSQGMLDSRDNYAALWDRNGIAVPAMTMVDVTLTMGLNRMPRPLEVMLASMREGEKAQVLFRAARDFLADPVAHCHLLEQDPSWPTSAALTAPVDQAIAGDWVVLLDVEVHRVGKDMLEETLPSRALATATERADASLRGLRLGDSYYAAADPVIAERCYSAALNVLKPPPFLDRSVPVAPAPTVAEEKRIKALRIRANASIAAVHYRTEAYDEALKAAEAAVALGTDHEAAFWHGAALFRLHRLSLARKVLSDCSSALAAYRRLSPERREARDSATSALVVDLLPTVLAELAVAERTQRAEERQNFSRMFRRLEQERTERRYKRILHEEERRELLRSIARLKERRDLMLPCGGERLCINLVTALLALFATMLYMRGLRVSPDDPRHLEL